MTSGKLSEDRLDPRAIVGDEGTRPDHEARLPERRFGDIPRLVGARAVADAVRDREHGCDRSIDHGSHPRIRVGVRARSGVRLSARERLEDHVHEPRHLTKALPALERLPDGDLRATTA